MKKRFKKTLGKIIKSPWTKFALYLLALIGVLLLGGAFEEGNLRKDFFHTAKELIFKPETVSFFFVGIVTIGLSFVMKMVDVRVEESKKIIDDHHEVICKYNGHEMAYIPIDNPFFYSKKGVFMELHHTIEGQKIKNYIKDKYSSEYNSMQTEIEDYYAEGVVYLPTVNIYTNLDGNCKVNFIDSIAVKELPSFVIGNGTEFLKAHRYSQTSNNLTVRLDDFTIDETKNEVTLHTSRTYYYHMLLTNRCMDYKLDCDMSVREIYEFNKTISPLSESKLSNQIGINGLVITTDGYLLLEKRDRKKTTWKNKFAQPISLALKASDLGLLDIDDPGNRKITSNEEGNKKLIGVIKKTLCENFGLTEDDYKEITLDKNFLGLARDLLEGGKPNLYFYVVVDCNSNLLLEKLNNHSKIVAQKPRKKKKVFGAKEEVKKETSKKKTVYALKTPKLSSKYFLVSYKDINIDFYYTLKLLRKNVKKVNRITYPRCSRLKAFFERVGYGISSLFSRYLEYECGEALLVSLSYLELCEKRIAKNENVNFNYIEEKKKKKNKPANKKK